MKKLFLALIFTSISSLTNMKKSSWLFFIIIIITAAMYFTQSVKNQNLLEASISGGTEEISGALSKGGMHFTTDRLGRTPLHLAARYSNETAVRILLLEGADPNARDVEGRTPLHMTRYDKSNNLDTIRVLLKYGANPNLINKRGESPLDIVKKHMNVNKEARELLIMHGAEDI